jgi:hypothetical protein
MESRGDFPAVGEVTTRQSNKTRQPEVLLVHLVIEAYRLLRALQVKDSKKSIQAAEKVREAYRNARAVNGGNDVLKLLRLRYVAAILAAKVLDADGVLDEARVDNAVNALKRAIARDEAGEIDGKTRTDAKLVVRLAAFIAPVSALLELYQHTSGVLEPLLSALARLQVGREEWTDQWEVKEKKHIRRLQDCCKFCAKAGDVVVLPNQLGTKLQATAGGETRTVDVRYARHVAGQVLEAAATSVGQRVNVTFDKLCRWCWMQVLLLLMDYPAMSIRLYQADKKKASKQKSKKASVQESQKVSTQESARDSAKYPLLDVPTTEELIFLVPLEEVGRIGAVDTFRALAQSVRAEKRCPGCGLTEEDLVRAAPSDAKVWGGGAHSVIARKTLEMAFLYGMCEFYCVGSPHIGVRDWRSVVGESMADVGKITTGKSRGIVASKSSEIVASESHEIIEELASLDKTYMEYTSKSALSDEECVEFIDLVRRDMHDMLVRIVRLPEGAGGRRALIAALCASYRHLLLTVLANQQVLRLGDDDRYVADLALVSCGEDRYNVWMLGDEWKSKKLPVPFAVSVVQSVVPEWKGVSQVEFSHQCTVCEETQGAFDLSWRYVQYLLGAAPKEMVGVAFFKNLKFLNDWSGVTPWGLTRAVMCSAISRFWAKAARWHPSKKEFSDCCDALVGRIGAAPYLFIAYMEALVLQLIHGAYRDNHNCMLVRMLEWRSPSSTATTPNPFPAQRGTGEDKRNG